MALALYRKYRPRTFAEVIGQEHVTEPLSQALRSGRLHHAYLFSGPRGCGKTSSARILARSLNCEQGPTPEPCGVCASCRSLANDGAGSIDVIEIDAASHGGVDDARDLREKAFFAPASSRYKIYVIDEAHMVSSAGFNALLKLVEEPPDYVKFIFATTEPEKVLGTIKSRTHHYPFRLIPPAVLRPYIQQLTEAEGVHVEPAVLPLVVRAGGGSARDTLSVLDQLIAGAGPDGVTYARAVSLLGVTDVALIDEMCDALAAGDGAAAYSTIDRVAEAGHDARRFASDLLERFRDLIIVQQVPDALAKGLIDGPVDQLDVMSAQATRLGPATLSRCADIVHNGLIEMRGTTAPRLLLELITARMLLPGADDSTGALLQRLERMERRLTLSGDSTDDSVRPQQPTTASGPSAGAPDGGKGISAARAAAAAAGRRAEAPPTDGGTGHDTAGQEMPAAVMHAGGPRTAGDTPDGASGPGLHGSGGGVSPVPEVGSEPAGSATAEKAWADEDVDEPDDDGDADGWDQEPNRVPSAHSRTVADQPDGPGRTATANRPQTADRAEAADRHEATARPAAASLADGSRKGSGRPAPLARAAEPAGVLPDAPEEPGAAVPAAPGQLSAAAIREVWPEIVATVGRQSKKVAALASGATVRELDGETLVLTFRFPAHAKMVAADPDLIVNALYEAVGGRWQIRCEVAGEAGGVLAQGGSAASPPARGAPVQKAPAQKAAARPAASAPARQREVVTPAASTSGDDDWPEPARPGGLAGPELSDEAIVESSDSAGVDDAGPAVADEGAARPAPPEGSGTANGGRSSGLAAARAAASGARNTVAARQGVPTPSAAVPNAEADSAEAGAGPPQSVRTETGRPKTASSESVRSAQPARSAAGRPEVAQSDAARVGVAPSDGGRTGATRPGAARSEAWSDGSAAEEPPYDPEYDGPPRGGAVAYEGFDPGDEPLDDVIDEKTARQSSEQQAMQLLHDAFGAEKIGEV